LRTRRSRSLKIAIERLRLSKAKKSKLLKVVAKTLEKPTNMM